MVGGPLGVIGPASVLPWADGESEHTGADEDDGDQPGQLLHSHIVGLDQPGDHCPAAEEEAEDQRDDIDPGAPHR